MKDNFLFISPDYPPPFIGGSLVYVHNLIENSNQKFTILSDTSKRIDTKNITYYESSFIKNSSSPKKYQLLLMYCYIFCKLYKIIRYKVVILNISAIGNGFFSFILSKLGVKVIIIVFAEEITLALNSKGLTGLLKRLFLKGYRNSNQIISISNFAKEILINQLDVKSKITVIPTPVHNSKFPKIQIKAREQSTIFKILSVGRLIKRKGFDHLLKTIKIIIDKGYNVQLTIIGNGPEYENLVNYINDNNLEKFVKIFLNANDQFLIEQYQSNDLFILANLMLDNGDCEGAPNVLIEAAAYGMPTIAGLEGGTSDVVDHNKTGILLNPADNENFATNIIDLMNDKVKIIQMGKNGFFKANNQHSKEAAGKVFSNLLKSLS